MEGLKSVSLFFSGQLNDIFCVCTCEVQACSNTCASTKVEKPGGSLGTS